MKNVYSLSFITIAMLSLPLGAQVSDDTSKKTDDAVKVEEHKLVPQEVPAPTPDRTLPTPQPQPVEPQVQPDPQPQPVEPQVQPDPQSDNSMPTPLDEEKSKQISRYFDEALQNYRDILGQQDTAETETAEKRIGSNEKLLEDQKQKLSGSKTSLRKVQLEYIRRFVALKNSYQQGNIDKKLYDQQLAKLAREYKFQMESLRDDVNFWKGQQGKTTDRLKALQDINRLNKIMIDKQPGTKTKQPQTVTELEGLVQKIHGLGFKPREWWTEPDVK